MEEKRKARNYHTIQVFYTFQKFQPAHFQNIAAREQDITVRLYPLSSGFDEVKPEHYNEETRCYYFRSMTKDN